MNNEKLLVVGAVLETFQSLKDKTLKLVFYTQEPTPDQIIQISSSIQSYGYLAFKKDNFKNNEVEMLNEIKSDYEDNGKSKSQRLRAVLYKNFEQDKQGYEVFSDYYNHHMERMINHWKNKLQ